MIVVGDIHGNIDSYLKLLRRYKGQSAVQIGDFGFGFTDASERWWTTQKSQEHGVKIRLPKPKAPRIVNPVLPDNAWFFRGNHDHPKLARQSPHFLGEYGVRELDGVKFFFLGGAWSIDRPTRIEGRDWWRDEELSIVQLNEAVELYADTKPDIVLSHDGPDVATDILLNRFSLHKTKPIPTRTGQALSAMYEIHQPKRWIFGHWHVNWAQQIGPTNFRCLAELGWCELRAESPDILRL